jgi:hypothetical protein
VWSCRRAHGRAGLRSGVRPPSRDSAGSPALVSRLRLLDLAGVEGDLVQAVDAAVTAQDVGGGAQPTGGLVGVAAGPVTDGVGGDVLAGDAGGVESGPGSAGGPAERCRRSWVAGGDDLQRWVRSSHPLMSGPADPVHGRAVSGVSGDARMGWGRGVPGIPRSAPGAFHRDQADVPGSAGWTVRYRPESAGGRGFLHPPSTSTPPGRANSSQGSQVTADARETTNGSLVREATNSGVATVAR